MKTPVTLLTATLAALATSADAAAAALQAGAEDAGEATYYEIQTIEIPEGISLEVGGLAVLPDGRVAAATRGGEVWIVEDPAGQPRFTRFAHGLHEPLGLAYRDGAFYAAQRGELTKLVDEDGDGRADVYETIVSWPLSGNYHEYSYGPVFAPDGSMYVTLNLAWIGHGASLARWRGWAVRISPDGELTPIAAGLRSPAGMVLAPNGDLFYSENQGDWVGSGFIAHVREGAFMGNPEGLVWSGEPGSPLRLRPEDVPNTGEPKHVVAQRVPELQLPAVWLPHGLLGISTSGMVFDTTGGAFGPFAGQLFVGDQGHSKISRVFLEQVDGVYQGAVFPFREGFSSGVLRLAWGNDGSLYVGMTNRGWSSTGRAPFGLQRVVWTGEVPFEPLEVRARSDGFEVTFTQPVDPATAGDPASYGVTSYTFRYSSEYGSPRIEEATHAVTRVTVSEDGLRARLYVEGLREGFVHELSLAGVRSRDGRPLLHDTAYYTLNRIP